MFTNDTVRLDASHSINKNIIYVDIYFVLVKGICLILPL
jgi:hypothetical protein